MSETLEQRIARLTAELDELQANETFTQDQIDRRNLLSNQLAEAEHELAQQKQVEQKHEERIQTANNEFGAYIQEALGADGLTMRDMCAGEKQYQLLSILLQQASTAITEKLSKQIVVGEEREVQLRRQNDDLQDKIDAIGAELSKTASDLQEANRRAAQFEFERDEALKVRDNAAAALEGARAEIDRLTSQVDDLRKEIAVSARNAFKVVDDEAQKQQVADLVKQIKDSLIRVTNIRWEDDIRKTHKLAERADTGETIRFPYYEKSKYLELTPEEGLQFRLQHQEHPVPDRALDEVSPPPIPDVTREQFRDGDAHIGDGAVLAEEQSGETTVPVGGTDQEAVSVAAFEALKADVEQLKADVKALKLRNGMVA